MYRNVTIDGQRFQLKEPYFCGYVISENEAAALNNLFAENIRNNFRFHLRAFNAMERFNAQHKLNEYARQYKFQPLRSRDYGDPVEEEARRIARDQIIQNAHKRGVDPEVTEEKITKTIQDFPVILEEAHKRIESIQNAANTLIRS